MELTEKKLSDLREFERNVRKHSPRQVNEIARSVQAWGQTRAIVCDESGSILVGNGLFRALQQLGWEKAQCYVIEGLSENEKKKLVLADNQTYNLGADDYDAIIELVNDIVMDGDMDIAGFEVDALEAMTFGFDDIEDELQSYGTITDEKLTKYTPPEPPQQAQSPSSVQPSPEPQKPELETVEQGNPTAKVDTTKTVICPSCGEVIRLD